ncbi:hypothetical protein F5050DRAFT_1709425 [Lentinula boryana]|uniref:Uncharacterized protein n=1 Tax=Lentinula boryana TaxID=40481 RepID=A0ABQ8QN35_9AGAR|nr:hypothetical protein F5050DRAFT_1709425 [Lentinula boryana]
MHFSQLVRVLLGAAFILHATIASPIPASGPGSAVLEKRTSIKLYHVTSAASAASIKSGGVKLQVKTTEAGHETGDDFNPKGTGGFYATDNSEEDIIDWCKRRNGAVRAKTNCADLVTFTFDESALHSLKYHKFVGPASASEDDQLKWIDTPDYEQYDEAFQFVNLCTHGTRSNDDVKLEADLADGGKSLDLVIGPLLSNYHIRQYAFRSPAALKFLKTVSVTATGV